MLFLPYRFALDLRVTPILTILVSVACLAVYAMQSSREGRLEEAVVHFCDARLAAYEQMMLTHVGARCPDILIRAKVTDDREALFKQMAQASGRLSGYSQAESVKLTEEFLRDTWQRFSADAPRWNPLALSYKPHEWNPLQMLTASFAHGSWSHVIGNLFFFFAFAAAVEAAIGSLAWIAVFLILAAGSHIGYSLAMISVPDALPSVGLSGVVMGMMALLTFLAPTGRINCFYWVFIRFGVIAVPAWALCLWYAGWDVYTLMSSAEMGEVNLVAHVSGAFVGYASGFLLFRKQKRRIAEELGGY